VVHQLPLLAEERATYTTQRDDTDRAATVERLRAKLSDPTFRAIEGFPIGDDESILALSDPPHYTACPNPFLAEIVAGWQEERRDLRAGLGLPDDGANGYSREPFAADVSEGKNDPIYNAHSYHTKVPHKAIMRYILHYTDPGDIVFDGFCGTGMTGVAAQLCGDKRAVESLGYRVDADGVVYDGQTPISRLGARKAVLVDLSPAATFIAYNYNTPVDVAAFEAEAKRILAEVEAECGWMYETWHPHCDHPQRVKARINYTIWSDVFVCPNCSGEIVFWNEAVDLEISGIRNTFECPHCRAEHSKRTVDRAHETVFDQALRQEIRRAKQKPVLINYSIGNRRFEKSPDSDDLALIRRIDDSEILPWYPSIPLPNGYNTRQPMESHGIHHIHQFFTKRNLWILTCLWARNTSALHMFSTTALMPRGSRMHRIAGSRVGKLKQTPGGMTIGLVTGTLYVPAISAEMNLLRQYGDRVEQIRKASYGTRSRRDCVVATSSTTDVTLLPSENVDYIFVDPPFGGNLMYSELNLLWEGWLRVLTNNQAEAIVNQVQGKGLPEYQRLMERCFREFNRVLKPGRWMTVEFHNSQNAIWTSIQEAVLRAGFMVADVRVLDKQQGSFKQYTTTSAVKQDLIISAYKPATFFEQRFHSQAGSESGAWAFADEHLRHLPLPQLVNGRLEVLAERQAYLLFDRMVAFHIQRGLTVPLGAAEFYAGLRQRYSERDSMYFLPLQASQYDRLRLEAAEVEQLPLIVADERSAILWLRRELGEQPLTYQDLQPRFLRELHQAGHEQLPELRAILEESFLQDEAGRWYVPDPGRAQDLERLRERALLREFGA
jgi:DNA modification methylase